MMKLNLQKLDDNLKKYEKQQAPVHSAGLSKVIRYIWNHYPTSFVDFDSFSYQDVIDAMESMNEIPYDDGDEDMAAYTVEENNPWYQNMLAENACSNLHHTKYKLYTNNDDFI